MTFDEIWSAIKQLCASAEFKQGDRLGETYISLPGIRYPEAGAMYEISLQAAHTHEDAAAKTWAKLMELNAIEPLCRDLGPAKTLSGRRYELLRWDGSNWIGMGFGE